MSTALSLFDATGILEDVMAYQEEVAKCDQCGGELGEETFNCCKGPETDSNTKIHDGHTVCKECADTFAYIGEASACNPCLKMFGARRSSVHKAGIALRPPIRNVLAGKMIHGYVTARDSISQVREQQEQERIQEGTNRRAAAVEEVRRRREEAEEAQKQKEQAELDAQKAEDARVESEKKRIATEELKKELERDVAIAQQRKDAVQQQANEQIERAKEEARRLLAQPPKVRKNRCMTEETLASMREKRKQAAQTKKRKLEHYDELLKEKMAAERRLRTMLGSARTWFVDRIGGDGDMWDEEMDRLMEEEEEEEGEEEEENGGDEEEEEEEGIALD